MYTLTNSCTGFDSIIDYLTSKIKASGALIIFRRIIHFNFIKKQYWKK